MDVVVRLGSGIGADIVFPDAKPSWSVSLLKTKIMYAHPLKPVCIETCVYV
jgi:hypothetical protein